MPTVPGAGFVMREAQLGFSRLERILNGPAMTLRLHQRVDRCPGRTPGREERQMLIIEAAPDQQTARPQAGEIRVVFIRREISQLEISPVVQARPLNAIPGR